MIRIIAGEFKGRNLVTAEKVKPTEQKVKKSLFDIMRNVVPESRFLDLYAGSGAVGIEALSRGADFVCFVENDSGHIKALKENMLSLKIPENKYMILLSDAVDALVKLKNRQELFDIVFADPPYYKGLSFRQGSDLISSSAGPTTSENSKSLAKKMLQTICAYDILSRNGFFIAEHHRREELELECGQIKLWRRKAYSTTILSFYCKDTSLIS